MKKFLILFFCIFGLICSNLKVFPLPFRQEIDNNGNVAEQGAYNSNTYYYYSATQSTAFATASLITVGGRKVATIKKLEIYNGNSSAITAGIGNLLDNEDWLVYYDSNSTIIDYTADAQDTGTNDVLINSSDQATQGILIGSDEKFSMVAFDISQALHAGASGTATFTFYYTQMQSGGATWTALTSITPTGSNFTATGATAVVFIPPWDWVTKALDETSATSTALYWIKIRPNQEKTSAANIQCSQVWVAHPMAYNVTPLATVTNYTYDFGDIPLVFGTANDNKGEGLIYYISGTTDTRITIIGDIYDY